MGGYKIPEIEVAGPAHSVFDLNTLSSVAADVFPTFLQRQRWYGAKSKDVTGIRLLDVITLALHPAPIAVTLLRAQFSEGPEETYQLVISVRPTSGESASPQDILRLACDGSSAVLYDALGDPGACQKVLEIIGTQSDVAGQRGKVIIKRAPCLGSGHFDPLTVRPLDVEQSNSSVIFDDALFLKVFRKIEFGINPDLELNLFLTQQAGFRHIPKLCGAIQYTTQDSLATLAIVQEYVPSGGTGWEAALQAVKDYLNDPNSKNLKAFERKAQNLGAMLGELHLALAREGQKPSFSPEPVTGADVSEWRASIGEQLEQVCSSLEGCEEIKLKLRAVVDKAFDSLEEAEDLGLKIRHHGDYHLGQVLSTSRGWMILDFEGEPNRSLEERRRKHTPLHDAAVMLQSFNYAAHTALLKHVKPNGDEWRGQQPYADAWEMMARHAFLQGYLDAVSNSRILPSRQEDRRKLLEIFELDRVIIETRYDLDNRPDWVDISLIRIRRILRGGRPVDDRYGNERRSIQALLRLYCH